MYLIDTAHVGISRHFPRTRALRKMIDHRALGALAALTEQTRVLALVLDARGLRTAVRVRRTAGHAETVMAHLHVTAIIVGAAQWAARAFHAHLYKVIQ